MNVMVKITPANNPVLYLCACLFLHSLTVNAQESNTSTNLIDITNNAYKAYTIRKLVIDQIIKAHPIKQQLADHWQENHHFTGFHIQTKNSNFSIDDNKGIITIDLVKVSHVFKDGDHIYLSPEIKTGHIDWKCQSTVTSNLVPASCQD